MKERGRERLTSDLQRSPLRLVNNRSRPSLSRGETTTWNVSTRRWTQRKDIKEDIFDPLPPLLTRLLRVRTEPSPLLLDITVTYLKEEGEWKSDWPVSILAFLLLEPAGYFLLFSFSLFLFLRRRITDRERERERETAIAARNMAADTGSKGCEIYRRCCFESIYSISGRKWVDFIFWGDIRYKGWRFFFFEYRGIVLNHHHQAIWKIQIFSIQQHKG